MLVMEKIDRYFSACLLASSGSSSPLSFLVMLFETSRHSGKDTSADTILCLCSGGVMEKISLNFDGATHLRQEKRSNINKTIKTLHAMTIAMKNRVQQAWRKDWMSMRIRVLPIKLGSTKARLSSMLSIRRESRDSRTTEKMDQTKEIMGITVPKPLGRQLLTWSQTTPSASATL